MLPYSHSLILSSVKERVWCTSSNILFLGFNSDLMCQSDSRHVVYHVIPCYSSSHAYDNRQCIAIPNQCISMPII